MFKGKQIFILIIQITISIVSSVLLYAIFGGHIIISLIVGNFIAAVCRGIYEDNCIKREYNNGVCKHCNTPYDIQKRQYVDPMGQPPGHNIDTAICNNCKRAVKIPGIKYGI